MSPLLANQAPLIQTVFSNLPLPLPLSSNSIASVTPTASALPGSGLSYKHTTLSPQISHYHASTLDDLAHNEMHINISDSPDSFGRSKTHVTRNHSIPESSISSVVKAVTFAGTFNLFGVSKNFMHAADDNSWIATSNSWLDRSSCRWLGLCGLKHLNPAGWLSVPYNTSSSDHSKSFSPSSGTPLKSSPNNDEQLVTPLPSQHFLRDDESPELTNPLSNRTIPDYVLEYAPYVYLYSGEEYWPGHISEHLRYTKPYLNYSLAPQELLHPSIDDLDKLNEWGRYIYLQSQDNVEEYPDWLAARYNIPWAGPEEQGPGEMRFQNIATQNQWVFGAQPDQLGMSRAPAYLITVQKEDGILDAFWFFFYSYNLGNSVFGVRFGNHVGDWEHMVVRFNNSTPQQVFLSEHDGGSVYSYSALKKIGKRPVAYSARGTHAMYATAGIQPYILPFGLLFDITDAGKLWDPLLNHASYIYDINSQTIESSTNSVDAPVGWLRYKGFWGDKTYRLDDPRQYRLAGQYHYVSGPVGPLGHELERKVLCLRNALCPVISKRVLFGP